MTTMPTYPGLSADANDRPADPPPHHVRDGGRLPEIFGRTSLPDPGNPVFRPQPVRRGRRALAEKVPNRFEAERDREEEDLPLRADGDLR